MPWGHHRRAAGAFRCRSVDPGQCVLHGDVPIARSGAISASGTSTKARSSNPRMRQRQPSVAMRHIVIGQQVDVERPRAPALLVGAVAAEYVRRQSVRKQSVRRERRFRP